MTLSTLDAVHACESTFAHSLGFETFEELIEASEPMVSSYGELWFILELPERHWLAWPFPEWDASHRFASYEEAVAFVRPADPDDAI